MHHANPFLSKLESIVQDARFGLRTLWKEGRVTAAAVLSLGLVIGACTAAFSLLDALILRPLPVPDADKLIYLTYPKLRPDASSSGPYADGWFSYPLLQRFRQAAGHQVQLFGITFGGPLMPVIFDDSGGAEEKVRSQALSGDAFSILGVKPALGRLLTADDDSLTSAHPVTVISYGLWKRRFGGNPGVLGRWLTLNGKQLQIVGVSQQGFTGIEPGYMIDLWAPFITQARPRQLLDPNANSIQVWGRLEPGATPQQVREALQPAFTNSRREQVASEFRHNTPASQIAKFVDAPLILESGAKGHDSLFRWQFNRPLWILGGFAILVLLIACSNVANLFIARAAAREREMGMRVAVGASRIRLIQQMLVESSLIAVAACVLGFELASIMTSATISVLAPGDFPIYLDLAADGRVLSFLALVAVSTTLLFGLAPALRASAVSPDSMLKGGSAKQSASIGILRPLLLFQILFSFAVLFVADLLLLSFQKLTSVDLGFSRNDIILFRIDAKKLEGESARVAGLQLLGRVRQLPSVRAVGFSASALVGGAYGFVITPTIRVAGGQLERRGATYLEVSPGFLDAMQIRLLNGRDFVSRDTQPGSASVIVNDAFAKRYFPGENPLGKQFERGAKEDSQMVPQQIVGVIGNIKQNSVRDEAKPMVYAPLRNLDGSTLEVRTAADPASMIQPLRREILQADPRIGIRDVMLQSTRIENTLLSERLLALLSAFFAIVALTLAAVGLYGVISHSSIRRTKEIGIRMALGAQRGAVVRLILSDIALVIGGGMIAGAATGWALSRFVRSLLYEVQPSDFRSLALPLACLLFATVFAALPPALRAAGLDPNIALRHE